MSTSLSAIRLCQPYPGNSSKELAQGDSQLRHYVVASSICFTILGIWILWMAHNERDHHTVIRDTWVSFELTCPEPEVKASHLATAETFKKLLLEGRRPAALSPTDTLSKDTSGDLSTTKRPVEILGQKIPTKLEDLIPEAPLAITHTSSGDGLTPPASAATGADLRSTATTHGGGKTDGEEQGHNNGGSGTGAGQGDQNSLMGGDFGANKSLEAKAARPRRVAMGNIRPYENDVINRIQERWHPNQDFQAVTVELTLNHDGSLVSSKIVDGTGSQQLDEDLLVAVASTTFAPLPEWYTGKVLHILLSLSAE